MTIDELNVKISVAADEAMMALDGLTRQLYALTQTLEQKMTVKLDTTKAKADVEALEKAAMNVGDAVKSRSQSIIGAITEGKNEGAGLLDMVTAIGRGWKSIALSGVISLVVDGIGLGISKLAEMRTLSDKIISALESAFDLTEYDSFNVLETDVRAALNGISDALRDPELYEATQEMQGYIMAAMSGIDITGQIDIGAFNEVWEAIFGEESVLVQTLAAIPGMTEEAARSIFATAFEMDGLGETSTSAIEVLNASGEAAAENAGAFAELGDAADETAGQFDDYSRKAQTINRQIGELGRQSAAISTLKGLSTQLKNCEKGSDAYNDAWTQVHKSLKDAGISAKDVGGSVSKLDAAIAGSEQSMAQAASGMSSDLNAVIGWAESTKQSLIMQGDINVNTSPAIAALNGLIAVARIALSLLSGLGVSGGGSTKGGGGGGGGGKKKDTSAEDAARAEEEAARAAEQARQEAIQRDYDYIDHRRHLNEITLEEELALIEQISRAHQLNAEEIMEWEEKVYDLKKEIRERDADSIDTLADGVVTALENRYEAMRDAEIDRLDASRESWEQWRDDSVQAIEDQIAALDKLSDTEDREAKDAEELRKIEKLRRDVEYEQDDYNKAKLQQQLDKALVDREERLRKLALQDQKDALKEEIDRINDKADEQIDALDKEQESIEAAYAERLKQAALEAEAQKLILNQSQSEIMDLLNAYVPEYDALGKSMGEKLLEGFQNKVGGIVEWFKSFNAGIVQAQEQMAAISNAAADSFYQGYAGRQESGSGMGSAGVTVNQNVTFNEPVESPSQVARRMEDVNDALGVLLG